MTTEDTGSDFSLYEDYPFDIRINTMKRDAGELELINNQDAPLLFQILVNDPEKISVSPSSGNIRGRSSTNFLVSQLTKHFNCKLKILVKKGDRTTNDGTNRGFSRNFMDQAPSHIYYRDFDIPAESFPHAFTEYYSNIYKWIFNVCVFVLAMAVLTHVYHSLCRGNEYSWTDVCNLPSINKFTRYCKSTLLDNIC